MLQQLLYKHLYSPSNFSEVAWSMLNRCSRDKLSNRSDMFVISLTSYPARIHTLYQAIESIFQQTVRPEIIHVWLSKAEFPSLILPSSLERLRKRGVRISFVDENLQSYKKLYYSLQEYPKSTIITIDDDIIYPRYWWERLLKENKNNPRDILCYRGHDLRMINSNSLMPYSEIKKRNNFGAESSFELMPTGVSGVLYPINSLNKQVLDKSSFMNLAPSGDDIWFKCCALLNKTKSRRVLPQNIHFRMIKNSQMTSLYYNNVIMNKNDEQLKKAFDYFNLYPYISLA